MMEYQSIIRFGQNVLKVSFTGGSMNAIGVTPATYTTDNFLIQQAIENSSEFQRGRIRKVREIDVEGEVPILTARATEVKPESPVATANVAAGQAGVAVAEENADEENSEGLTEVEFSCNDDAKDYLENTFGVQRSKLRNRQDIVNAGLENKVDIRFE